MTVWIKTTLTGRGFLRGLGEVFAHIWAYGLRWSVFWPVGIVNGVEEFVRWLNSFPAHDGGVTVLRVMSHGHSLATLDGTVVGSDISVGETENIRSDDFDNDGNLLATPHAQRTKKLLDAFKASVSPNGRLIFSACEQGTGGLLQHISQHVDKHVSVEGWSGLGFPWLRGDMFYKDGVQQEHTLKPIR
jgi:hypothetical protein